MVLSESAAEYIQKLDDQHKHYSKHHGNRRYSRRIAQGIKMPEVSKKLKEMKMPSAPKVNLPKVQVPKKVANVHLKDIKMPSAPKVHVPNVKMRDIKMPSAPKAKVPTKLKETMKQKHSQNKEAVSSYLAKRKAKRDEKKRTKSLLHLQMELQQEKKHLQQERASTKQSNPNIPRRQLQFPPTIERQYGEAIFHGMMIEEESKAQEHSLRKLHQLQQDLSSYQPPSKIVWREESDEETSVHEEEESGETKDEDDDVLEMEKHIRWQDLEPHTAIFVQPASVEDVDLQQQMPHDERMEFKLRLEPSNTTTNTTWEEFPSSTKTSTMFDDFQQGFPNFDLACEFNCQPILQNMNDIMTAPSSKKQKTPTTQETNKDTTETTDNLKVPETVVAVRNNNNNATVDAMAVLNDALNETLDLSALLNSTVESQATPEQFLCGIDPDFVKKSMEHHDPLLPKTPAPITKVAAAGTPDTAPMDDDYDEDKTPKKKTRSGGRHRKRATSTKSTLDSLFGDLSCGMTEFYNEFYGEHEQEKEPTSDPPPQQQEGLDLKDVVQQILWA